MPKGIVALSKSLRGSGAFMSPREKRTLKKTPTFNFLNGPEPPNDDVSEAGFLAMSTHCRP